MLTQANMVFKWFCFGGLGVSFCLFYGVIIVCVLSGCFPLYMGNGFYLSLFILYFLFFILLSLLSYLLWFLVCIFGSRFLGVGLSVGFVCVGGGGADIIRTHFLYSLSSARWHVATGSHVLG
jgi:hypothetical protein